MTADALADAINEVRDLINDTKDKNGDSYKGVPTGFVESWNVIADGTANAVISASDVVYANFSLTGKDLIFPMLLMFSLMMLCKLYKPSKLPKVKLILNSGLVKVDGQLKVKTLVLLSHLLIMLLNITKSYLCFKSLGYPSLCFRSL